jgi:ribose transport system ATP-binding protein
MADAKALRARELVIAAGVDPISLTIAPGEIVGLAGLDGHGQ